MRDTVWDAALEAVAARLAAEIDDVKVETDRREPVDVEDYPRLVVELGDDDPDHTQSPGETFYRMNFLVSGYAAAPEGAEKPDTAARRAVNALRARVVKALHGWQDPAANISDALEVSCERNLDAAEESAPAAGDFTSTFTVLVVAPAGDPWASPS